MIIDVIDLYKKNMIGTKVNISGWIKNHRKQKDFGFIDFYDGTCFKSIQLVYTKNNDYFEELTKLSIGSAIEVEGEVITSEGKNQDFEIDLNSFKLLGDSPSDYPIQPKRHTREFLREVAYLRPRTNLFNAVFRVRSKLAYAIHSYFNSKDYLYLNSPIITGSDCEGAGEMFSVSSLDFENIPKNENLIDYSKDFFKKQTALTVSGQLQAEAFALAFKKVYTFGPTFRAEKSNTKTHASEFWMIEPEIAFCDLNGLMDIQEDFVKYLISYVLNECNEEMLFFDKFVENGLIDKLKKVINTDAVRIKHREAMDILINSGVKFENQPEINGDFAKEHEKYLTDIHFNGPVFITDWPKEIKAFYMRNNQDNTVAAVDLLVPGAGELMGGSQREERIEMLRTKMKEFNISEQDLEWYINLRKFGSCIHSGFGMGFERLIIYLTGVDNIRDVIPFPRTPGNCLF